MTLSHTFLGKKDAQKLYLDALQYRIPVGDGYGAEWLRWRWGHAAFNAFSAAQRCGDRRSDCRRGCFLDLNNNLSLDDGEPFSDPTGKDGVFRLSTAGISSAQLATATLVSHVPDSAFDEDDAGISLLEAGRHGFTLMSPLVTGSTSPALSPLSSLVAYEIIFNGKSLAEAKSTVQQTTGLGSKDPLSDYIAEKDSALQAKARAIAIAKGEINERIKEAVRASSVQSDRKTEIAQTMTALKTVLPEVLPLAGNSSSNCQYKQHQQRIK